MKVLESYSRDDMKAMAKKAKVVYIDNKKNTEDYTLTKKTTANISHEVVALHNAFNKILTNITNVKALQEFQSKNTQNVRAVPDAPVLPKIMGAETMVGNMEVLGKYVEKLAVKLKKLDLNSDGSADSGTMIDVDIDKGRRRGGRRGGRRAGVRGGRGLLGLGGKALGIFGVGLDATDRIGSGEDLAEAGVGVAGGVAGGAAGAYAGAALGALGGPAAPITVPLGGLVGGALGYFAGGKIADKSYDTIVGKSPAERQLESVTARTAVPPARREAKPIGSDSYSSRFADYLKDTFQNVKSYIGGLFGRVVDSITGSGDQGMAYDGSGAGMTGNAQIAMDFFTSPQGGEWTREQAAGIVGNLQGESGSNLRVDAVGDSGDAYGIAQWNQRVSPDRVSNFRRIIGTDLRESNLQQQLQFVAWELQNTERSAGNRLRNTRDVQSATVAMSYYERYRGYREGLGSAETRKRIANATSLITASTTMGPTGPLTGGQLMNPVPGARLSSMFGRRSAPTAGASTNHKGIDLAAPNGTPILAAGAGTVTFAGALGSAGNVVEIDHGGGLVTKYFHMSSFLVQRGSIVQAGQRIGAVGSTGRSTGNHLHFEVVKDGEKQNPLAFISGSPPPPPPPVPQWRESLPWSQQTQQLGPFDTRRRGNTASLLILSQPAPASQAPVTIPYRIGRGPSSSNANPRYDFLGYHE